jgi:hypothetical protein
MAIPISFLQNQPENERSKTKPPSNNPVVQQAFVAGLGADSATVVPPMASAAKKPLQAPPAPNAAEGHEASVGELVIDDRWPVNPDRPRASRLGRLHCRSA